MCIQDEAGKILARLVSARGIEMNPKKIESIVNMQPPSSRKLVQKLTGCLTALNKFISHYAEKDLPFFHMLLYSDYFKQGAE